MTRPPRPRICRVDNCGRRHMAFGLCNKHYKRFHKGLSDAEGNPIVNLCHSCGKELEPVRPDPRVRACRKCRQRTYNRRRPECVNVGETELARLNLLENLLEAREYGTEKKPVCLNCGRICDSLSNHLWKCPVKPQSLESYREERGYARNRGLLSPSVSAERARNSKSQQNNPKVAAHLQKLIALLALGGPNKGGYKLRTEAVLRRRQQPYFQQRAVISKTLGIIFRQFRRAHVAPDRETIIGSCAGKLGAKRDIPEQFRLFFKALREELTMDVIERLLLRPLGERQLIGLSGRILRRYRAQAAKPKRGVGRERRPIWGEALELYVDHKTYAEIAKHLNKTRSLKTPLTRGAVQQGILRERRRRGLIS
jgi:hypothetical protein